MEEKEKGLRLNGEVIEALPNAMFRVQLEKGHLVLARLSGKMRTNFIKVLPGDWVTLELSTYDLARGRIITRLKPEEARLLIKNKEDNSPNPAEL